MKSAEPIEKATSKDWVDHRGCSILVGSTVCYNYSGEIALGEVINIKVVVHRNRERIVFEVKRLAPHPGKHSRVMKSKNLMVIHER